MQKDAFLVHARLGSGSTGAVFRASRADDGRQVALKALHPDFVRSTDMDHLREVVAALGQVQHHGVASGLELVTWRGDTVLVREYIRGVDLGTLVAGSAPPQRIALKVISEVAGALAAVEQVTGQAHGDVKPSNVFLDALGDVKLVDFGMSQPVPASDEHTLTMFHGSVGFMAPERVDKQLAPTSDVYSVGLMLAWMLTGEMPRRTSANPKRHAKRREALLERVASNLPPEGAAALIADCTLYDPARRPPMHEVARRLAELSARASGPRVQAWAGPLVDALVAQPVEVDISDVGQPLSATADAAPLRQASAASRGEPFKKISTGAHELPGRKRAGPPIAWIVGGSLLLILVVAAFALGIALSGSG